jgi:divalent metal cation (Fe/Co/Zn/Cd) transporter
MNYERNERTKELNKMDQTAAWVMLGVFAGVVIGKVIFWIAFGTF